MSDRGSIQLKVAGKSNVNSVAGAVARNLEEGKKVSLVAIGAGAVNQMVKAVAIARGMVAQAGQDLYFTAGFVDEMIGNEKKTAIKFYVFMEDR